MEGSCRPMAMLAKGSRVVGKRVTGLGNEEQGDLSFIDVGAM